MNVLQKVIWSLAAGYNAFEDRQATPAAYVDENGIIHASSYIKAAELRDGITPEGARYKTLTNVGPNQWKAETKEFDV